MKEMAEETCGKKGSCGELPLIEKNFEERVEMFKGDLKEKDLIDSVKSKLLFLSMKHSIKSVLFLKTFRVKV